MTEKTTNLQSPMYQRHNVGAMEKDKDLPDKASVVSSLTVSLSSTYTRSETVFQGSVSPVCPAGRVLTKPAERALTNGFDNINDDLIVAVNDVFVSSLGHRYVVVDSLGHGTFGQVFKCTNQETGETVAVKVIKNQAAYYHQARVEIGLLQFLNTKADSKDENHIVRLQDFFMHKKHLCLVFELLNINLFELIRHNKFRGLSLSLVRVFLAQLLKALVVLRDSNIIHCDIKPENVLLVNVASGDVKLIDFGSACFCDQTVYTYIQSRFYRSPEVILGHPYTMAVDMWSLGCVAAELFLGLPLFPAACELDLLGRVVETIGEIPDRLIATSKNGHKFFIPNDYGLKSAYRIRSAGEFFESTGQKATRGKQYFQHKTLGDIINAYPYRSDLSESELIRERLNREAFTDFLMGLLDCDLTTRWSPRQAQSHPFIAGTPFIGPYQPAPDPLVISSAILEQQKAFSPSHTAPGLPMSIPHARNEPTVPIPAATVFPPSPQMHAQAHIAAMAAVRAQMDMAEAGAVAASPYSAAHSLQRIMVPLSSSLGTMGSFGRSLGQPSPLQAGLLSPPTRSFGVHLHQQATEMPPPSFDPHRGNYHRVMPLLHLSDAQQQNFNTSGQVSPSNNVAFQPCSVSTYRSTLAAVVDGTAPPKEQYIWSKASSVGGTPPKEASVSEKEEVPNPADWDPLWSDDLLKEDEPISGVEDIENLTSLQGLAIQSPTGLSLAAQHLTQLHALQTEPSTINQRSDSLEGQTMVWSPPRNSSILPHPEYNNTESLRRQEGFAGEDDDDDK